MPELDGNKIRFKRGLLRLFIAFSVCWYLCAAYVLWPMWTSTTKHYRLNESAIDYDALAKQNGAIDAAKDGGSKRALKPDVFDELHAEEIRPTSETVFSALIPVALFCLGISAFWVVDGFKPNKQSSN